LGTCHSILDKRKTWLGCGIFPRNSKGIPKDRLSPKPINSPPKKYIHTHQQIMIMEGVDEDIKADVITQHDDESTRMGSD
jgi:hypothetical protein